MSGPVGLDIHRDVVAVDAADWVGHIHLAPDYLTHKEVPTRIEVPVSHMTVLGRIVRGPARSVHMAAKVEEESLEHYSVGRKKAY